MTHDEWCEKTQTKCPFRITFRDGVQCERCKIAYEAGHPPYTVEKPKVPGWYWRRDKLRKYEVLILEITQAFIDLTNNSYWELYEFSGPIQEPREP